jgi:hypothetical protein
MTEKKTESSKSYETIKLGIDAHSKWYHVARQLDGATLQSVQKMVIVACHEYLAQTHVLAQPTRFKIPKKAHPSRCAF